MTTDETAPVIRPGVSSAMLARAGVRRVTADEARELCGLAEPGLWIPFHTPTGEPIMDTGDQFPEPRPYGRLRLDVARTGQKYHSWKESHPHVYIPPGQTAALAANGGDLHIIEGEFKALALAETGFAAVGLAGFNCHARQHGAGSDTAPELLPGLQTILAELKPRRLLFTGDSDTCINWLFADAAAKLARDAGVPVMMPRIPWDGPGKGADDCRAALGDAFPDWWRKRIAAAIPVVTGRPREEIMLAILEPEIKAIEANPGDTGKTCKRLAELVGVVKGNPLVAEKITALVAPMFGGREKLRDAVEEQAASRKPPAKTGGAASRATITPDQAALTLTLLVQGERLEAHVSPIDAAAAGQPYPLTDAGFAERIAFHVKEKAFFHAGRGRWFVWGGAHWQEGCKEIEGYAVETARLIKKEVAAYPAGDRGDNKDAQKKTDDLLKFAFTCESLGRISNAIKLAASVWGMAKRADKLDADPMLLCCGNGTVNLKTGELYPHRKTDYITKGTPVEYDPTASHPLFDKFMANATGGDAAFETYLRRAAGYSLTGDISEKCLFFLFNTDTDTGKTTFLEALRTAAGEYAAVINFELFSGDGGAHSNPKYDLAKLAGARFVSCSEIRRGQRLAPDTIKRCTGGDSFPVRDCGEKSFVLKPAFKLWLAANDPPSCPDDDPAFWNRMKRVPFGHRVPKEKRDPNVLKSLTTPDHPAARAFLAWAVRGAIEWFAHGLGACSTVEKSTTDYQEESSPLQIFFADCCRFSPEAWVTSTDLRREYVEWATTEGVNPKYHMSPKVFAGRLVAKGCTSFKVNHGERAWRGIEVIEHENYHGGVRGRIESKIGEVPYKETFLREVPPKPVLSAPSRPHPAFSAQNAMPEPTNAEPWQGEMV